MRNTSCTVPVPVYRHFSPESVGYCTLKLGGVLPRRTLIRPGTIRVTCGQCLMMWLRISSSPLTRPCWRLILPNFIRCDYSGARAAHLAPGEYTRGDRGLSVARRDENACGHRGVALELPIGRRLDRRVVAHRRGRRLRLRRVRARRARRSFLRTPNRNDNGDE